MVFSFSICTSQGILLSPLTGWTGYSFQPLCTWQGFFTLPTQVEPVMVFSLSAGRVYYFMVFSVSILGRVFYFTQTILNQLWLLAYLNHAGYFTLPKQEWLNKHPLWKTAYTRYSSSQDRPSESYKIWPFLSYTSWHGGTNFGLYHSSEWRHKLFDAYFLRLIQYPQTSTSSDIQ